MLSRPARERMAQLAHDARYVELSLDAGFSEAFVDAMELEEAIVRVRRAIGKSGAAAWQTRLRLQGHLLRRQRLRLRGRSLQRPHLRLRFARKRRSPSCGALSRRRASTASAKWTPLRSRCATRYATCARRGRAIVRAQLGVSARMR